MVSRKASATDPVVTTARPADAMSAPVSPARWVQPSAASRIGSCAKFARTNESGEPDAIDANRSPDAAPAPTPMRRICIIVSCPARRAVRGESRPNHRPAGDPPGLLRSLPDDVVQKPEEARPLDCARKLTLFFCRDRSDAAWHDLAALGNVTLQQLHVFVIDLRRVGTGERAGLAAAEERAAPLG